MTTVGDGLYQYGGAPVASPDLLPAEVSMVVADGTTFQKYWNKRWKRGKQFITLAAAYARMTSNQGDTIYMAPGTYTHTALLTWAHSNCALIGMHAPNPFAKSVYIVHSGSTAVSPIFDITGSDNYFRNLHFYFGGSNAAQHIGLRIVGQGNTFENCWFEGPVHATQADDTAVEIVQISGGAVWATGNYFKNCMFGTTAVDTAGAAVLGYTSQACENVFEGCTFFHQASSTAAVFIDISATYDIAGLQLFKNCIFTSHHVNHAAKDAVAVRIVSASPYTGMVVFDPACTFNGISAIANAGTKAIWSGHPQTATHAGEYAGLIDSV